MFNISTLQKSLSEATLTLTHAMREITQAHLESTHLITKTYFNTLSNCWRLVEENTRQPSKTTS